MSESAEMNASNFTFKGIEEILPSIRSSGLEWNCKMHLI